jgi:hypothetical protein
MGAGSESCIRGGWIGVASVALTALSLFGCGGRTMLDDGPACDEATGCGGDITGNWSIKSMCFFANTSATAPSLTGNPDCDAVLNAALASSVVTPKEDATITFDEGLRTESGGVQGQYTESGTVHVKATYGYTAACLAVIGAQPPSPENCDQFAAERRSIGYDGSCQATNDECVCTLERDQFLSEQSGYETQGTNIYFPAVAADNVEFSPYCVHGNQAKIGAPPSVGFSGTLLLEKKSPPTL